MSKNKKSKTTASSKKKVSKKKLSLPAFFSDVKMNCLFIFLLSFLLYGMTIQYDYTQDDAIVITKNEFTKKGVSGIKDILENDAFVPFFGDKKKRVTGGRYRPLTFIFFAIGWDIFGDNPAAFHFMTVLFYALTGIVLYLLLLKMLRPSKGDNFAFFVAMVTTVLFIVHPIHTEVVANIKGCDEIVTLLASLAALYFSLRAFYEKNILFTMLAGIVFFLALMSKENAITFVVIVPLVYYFFTKADTQEILLQTLPFLVMAGVFLIIRHRVLGWDLGNDECTELMNCPYLDASNNYQPYTASQKYGTIFYTLGQYVKLLFFPHPLTHDYYPYAVGPMSFGNWKVLLSLFMYVGLGFYSLWGILKKDIVAFGIAFYLITLSIVSNIVFPVGTNMAERFAFMPSVGFCLVIAVLAYRGWQFFNQKDKSKSAINLKMILAGVGIITLLFSLKTILRNPAFKDNYTLFTTDVKISKTSAKVQNSAGGELIEKARTFPEGSTEYKDKLNQAVGHLNEAIRIHPRYSGAYFLLGNAHQYLNKFEEAIQYYNLSLQLNSGSKDADANLTIAYRDGGKYFGEKEGNLQKALQYLTVAYQRNPNDVETLRLLGIVHGSRKEIGQAIQYLEQALKLEPQNASIMFNLGIAIDQAGDTQRAAQLIEKAKEIDPNIGN